MLVGKDTWLEVDKHMGKNGTTGHVLAEIAWHQPKFEDKVVLDFWHSPIDTHTKDFMTNFDPEEKKQQNISVLAKILDYDLPEVKNKDLEDASPVLDYT